MRKKLGECLVQAGLITEADLQTALEEHRRSGQRLGVVLVRLNMATERQIAKTLAYQLGFTYVNLVETPPEQAAVVLIPKEVALKRNCIAVGLEKNQLTVAMSDPLLFSVVQDLEFQTGHRIKQVVATRGEIVDAIHAAYPDRALTRSTTPGAGVLSSRGRTAPAGFAAEGGSLTPYADAPIGNRRAEDAIFESPDPTQGASSDTGPIIELVDLIIQSALKSRASDIHIEPGEKGVTVRQRLDGLLKEAMDLPKWVHEGLVARFKIMAGMDIAEKRLPQDGRLRTPSDEGPEVDFRVSTLRTIFGEKLVLRVLDHRKGVPPLEELGLAAPVLEQIRHFLRHQHGMILVVGPTGSGKTTTLCSALTAVRSERTNIVTIEDPVEYQIPGVNQTQINDKIKLTFAGALRSILRQDPDVVLVGEIRDQETARIAMQAAQTGHLVLSTLHTDDAPSCITRLTDIGIEPYVSASALIGVVAQRLMRRLCTHCRRPYTPDADTLRAMSVTDEEAATLTFYRAVGCDHCHHTGYRGRVGIYEVMPVNDRLRRLIAQKGSEAQLREAAISGGMLSLGEDGLQKVKAGVTTPDELLRVVTEVRAARATCAGCGASVSADFMACPSCGHRVGAGCPHCERPLQPGWKFCPYCSRSTEAPRRSSKRLRDRHEGRELPAGNVTGFRK